MPDVSKDAIFIPLYAKYNFEPDCVISNKPKYTFVKAPVDGVKFPIGVEFKLSSVKDTPVIEPPVIVALAVDRLFNVAKPVVDSVVNAPELGVTLPIGVLLTESNVNATFEIDPPVIVAFDVDKLFNVARPVVDKVVNAPVLGVVFPIGVLFKLDAVAVPNVDVLAVKLVNTPVVG